MIPDVELKSRLPALPPIPLSFDSVVTDDQSPPIPFMPQLSTVDYEAGDKTTKADMSYESKRKALKFGTISSAYLMFQTTVGISLFTLQSPFCEAGLVWSLIICVFCCYLTSYGLLTILRLVDQVEALQVGGEKRFQNLYTVAKYLKGPHVAILRWIMTVACVGMMLTSSISNLMLTTKSLGYFVHRYTSTFFIYLMITGCLFVIVEPEKIKPFTTLTTLIVMFVAVLFTSMNLTLFFTGQAEVSLKDVPLFGFDNTFKLTGNLIYAFELCSCYLSLRMTSSHTVNYSWLTKRMMIVITGVYYIAGASFVLAFPKHKITESAFEIYHTGIFKYFAFAYSLNTVYNFITNTIFACEVFESIGFIRKHLVDEGNSIQRQKIIMLRVCMWTFTVLLSLVSGSKVTSFLNFSGSVFSPIVGFIGPLIYYYTFMSNQKKTVLPIRKVHDAIYLGITFVIAYFGIKAVI
jgi:hypothetical protein